MAVQIQFDSLHNPIQPTIVLTTRNGRKLGKIPVQNVAFKASMNNGFDMSFDVYKAECSQLWDKIINFKCVWAKEWNQFFEIKVETDDDGSLTKSVTATSLGKAELSQIKLYGKEINTENDIERDDFEPTVFYNESNPKASLLHRLLEKAPHYCIGHVDTSLKKIQRTFSFNDKTIQDGFREVSEEIDCLILIDCGYDTDNKLVRSVNAYDLKSVCLECGTRGNFDDKCDKCGSTNICHGYGEDTNIFVSTENLADNIKFATDTGSVKNCFKLEAGDDLATAAVISCNPNGSEYLWNISETMKADMSDELIRLINEYDEMYDYYQNEYSIAIEEKLRTAYNNLIDKYSAFTSNYKKLGASIVGYPALMERYFDTIDFGMYLSSKLMPAPEVIEPTAQKQIERIKDVLKTPVSVKNIKNVSAYTAESAISAMAKAVTDSRYKITISESTFSNNVWSGVFTVTNYSNESDTAKSNRITCYVNGNYEGYVKQKILKAINKSVEDSVSIEKMFALSDTDFANEMKKYCLSSLTAFHNTCQTCVDILIEQGLSDSSKYSNKDEDLYSKVYLPYYNKLQIIGQEIIVREDEIAIVAGKYDNNGKLLINGIQTFIKGQADVIHDFLNFEKYIGEEHMLEFAAYRREDTYKNPNYVSDGLNNAELFRMALDFIETAKSEIYKASTQQHTISAKLRNLLAMKEFKLIVDKFEIGNWIRIRTDGKLYKLRLIGYEIDFDNFDNIDVDFSDLIALRDSVSDVESILNQASSMASSYEYVARQANKGEASNSQLIDWVERGMDLTKMKIVDSADNQNITWDNHGLLCKEYLPISGEYDDKQLKIINRGLYLTDDGWKSSKAGIGDFTYWNPKTGKMEESYGVIADVIVGNIILSEEIGIYNEHNSLSIDNNGFALTSYSNGDAPIFTIQRKNQDGSITKLVHLDEHGKLVLNGSVQIGNGVSLDSLANDIGSANSKAETAEQRSITNTVFEYASSTSGTVTPTQWQSTIPSVSPGNYLWTKTTYTYGNGRTQSVYSSVRHGINGTNGADGKDGNNGADGVNGNNGLNSATIMLFKRSSSVPGKPSGTITYTFATSSLSSNLDGWSTSVPFGSDPCYLIKASVSSSSASVTIAQSQWSVPVVFVQNGVVDYSGIEKRFEDLSRDIYDNLNNYVAPVDQYMSFDSDSGLILGASDNPFKVNITNDRIAFLHNGATTAYINGQQLFITDAVITSSLYVGGYYFTPLTRTVNGEQEQNGMAIVWKGLNV